MDEIITQIQQIDGIDSIYTAGVKTLVITIK